MVRAFSTLGCPEADLRGAVTLATRHHVDAIELRALADTINLPAYFAAQFGTPDAFGAAVRGLPVQVVSLDTSLHLADAKAHDREQFLAFVPWAEAAGIRWLRVFDGGAKLTERAAIHAAADTIRWWREVREDSGFACDVMVETHNRLLTSSAVREFLALAPGTAILWDAHHTWRQGGERPAATWSALRGAVVHVHVKDSVPATTPNHPYRLVLPGQGDFPIRELRDAVITDGYHGAISLEWEKVWHPELPPLEDALRAAEAVKWW